VAFFAARLFARPWVSWTENLLAIASADNAPSTKFYREPAVAGPNASNPVYDRRAVGDIGEFQDDLFNLGRMDVLERLSVLEQ
jgi:hypothetical protein